MSRTLTQTIAAGGTWETPAGDKVYLVTAADPVDLSFVGRGGRILSVAEGATASFKQKFAEPFAHIRIVSATSQTITIIIADPHEDIDMNVVGGAITTSSVVPSTIETTPDATIVAAAAAAIIVPADTDRISVKVTNIGVNPVRIGDVSTAAAQGDYLGPGAWADYPCNAAIYAYSALGTTISIVEVKK